MRVRRVPRGCGAALTAVVALVTLSSSVARTQGPKRGGALDGSLQKIWLDK